MRSIFYVFVPSEGEKIILTAQKHQESIRNGIVDLRKKYYDHRKRQRADFGQHAVLGAVKKIPMWSVQLKNSHVNFFANLSCGFSKIITTFSKTDM